MKAVQLSFEACGLDPRTLAELSVFERIELYGQLGLHPSQRQAIEEAIRLVASKRYGRRDR